MFDISKLAGIQLDIACGSNKQPGFVGIDIQNLPGVDIVCDLEVYPWPLPDECVLRAICSHYIEHINPAHFGMIKFMDEVWRVLKVGSQFAISMPYAGSPGYWQDPTHCNGCTERTWAYFDPKIADGLLYNFYKPKPWRVDYLAYDPVGNMEVILWKRGMDEITG